MPAHTIRVLCDSKHTSAVVADANTNEPLFWWRGNDLRVELALSDFGAFLLAADVGTITVVVKNSGDGPDDSPLMIETIGAADCDAGFVGSQWIAKTGELCVAEWTRAEAALDAGDYRIIVSHDDGAGKRSTFLSSKITVLEDHHDSVSLSAPPLPAAEYYTKPEADARFPLTATGATQLPELTKQNLARQWPEAVAPGASVLRLEQSKNLPGVPISLGGDSESKLYDLDAKLGLWGWWQVRVGASNSTSIINFPGDAGGAIERFFDSTANDRRLQPAGANASLWAATNVISTGELSASFATSRPYYVTSAGAISADGCAWFGVSDSDDADTSTTPQILASVCDATGVILSLEQYGTTLRVRHRDSGGTLQTNATSYTVTADLAFSWLLNFDKANGIAEVFVNNTSVGRFTGLTFTADVYDDFVWSGKWDGTTASEGWDGQHAELGAVARPLFEGEIAVLFNYLKAVSALTYELGAENIVLHRASEADIAAFDASKQAYEIDLNLPAGRIAVGLVFSSFVAADLMGKTLSVTHPTGSGSTTLSNGLDNLDLTGDRELEDGLVFVSSGGSGTLAISIDEATTGEFLGIVVRKADALSGCIEDQGSGTHCHPLAIRHSNGKLYRIHQEMYTSSVYLSDGEGNSVQVFSDLQRNDRYHTGVALIELDDGKILVSACSHNASLHNFRTVSADLATLSAVRNLAGGGTTYIHMVKASDGSVYTLSRDQSGTFGATLLHIEDPENLATSATTSEEFAQTSLRLYPRKLLLVESNGVEYLIAAWATRDNAEWEGFAAAYKNLSTGVWYNPEGDSSPNATAPYFVDASFSSSIVEAPGTDQCVITRNTGEVDQWYALNDVLAEIVGGELRISTLYSTSENDSFSYGPSPVYSLTYSPSLGVVTNEIEGLSSNSYRVDCQFLPLTPTLGILVTSKRGARGEPTDFTGDTTPLYYDWYGEDFRAHLYIFEEGELFIGYPRDIVTDPANGLTHGWLNVIPGERTLDVQVADNEMHHTHRQAVRKTITF